MTEIPYPAHPTNYRVGRRSKIDRIVIHVTNGPSGAPWVWFGMDHGAQIPPAAPTSAHVSVDPGGLVYRSVPDQDTAFHAGAYNDRSLGVEIVGWNGYDFPDVQLDRTAELIAGWATRYGLPADRVHIVGHNEVPGEENEDPGIDFNWSDFMTRIQHHMNRGVDASTVVIFGFVVALVGAAFMIRG